MAVRNFWIEVEIDGRKTKLTGGPVGKNGGMRINLYQRSNGEITKPLSINCYAVPIADKDEILLETSVMNTTGDPNYSDSWGYVFPMTTETTR